MFHRTHSTALVPAIVGLLMSGCSRTSETTSTTAETVIGMVTLDGQPLTAGLVNFHPVGGETAAYAVIANDGTYRLLVPAGEYLVTVSADEPAAPQAGAGRRPAPPRAGKRLTPEKYAKKETTDLRATVRAGSNSIPLALKTEDKAGIQEKP